MCSYPFNPDKPPSLVMGLQHNSFMQAIPPACSLDLSVAASRLRDRLSDQSPPHSVSLTHTKWNFVIKYLFACSWDSLKRFRRKALRGNEPNADVCRQLMKRIYQYVIQVYNCTVCTVVS